MKRKNGSTDEQIIRIMETETYKSGSEFTLSDILDKINDINCKHRMNSVLTEMHSRCLLDKQKDYKTVKYRKPVSRLLRIRWVSEMAESLRDGDNPRTITGQAARDVVYGSRLFAGSCQEACGGGL